MRFCGISTGSVKKERVGTQEQEDSNDEVNAMLNTRLASRKIASKQIKEMFGIELTPKLRKAEEKPIITMPTSESQMAETESDE